MLPEFMTPAAHLPNLPLRILTKARPLVRHTPWHSRPSPGSCPHARAAVHSVVSEHETLRAVDSKSKIIRDVLSPTPSHLLTLLLSDMLRGGHEHADLPPASHPLPPNTDKDTPTHTWDSSPPASLFTAPQALPPGHSLVYFPLQTPASKLAPDGADADHLPDARFGRRLWAGGELSFRRRTEGSTPTGTLSEPAGSGGNTDILLDCSPWTCREDVRGVKRSGERYVVRLERTYARGLGEPGVGAGAGWDIRETRTLVFKRGDAGMVAPSLTRSPHAGSYTALFTPTPTHLFHFSALTYNAHGIHFDPLAARHDGHPALLVHGPLTLALMLRVLGDHLRARPVPSNAARRIVHFAYRNYAPLYAAQRAAVRVRRVIRGPEGQAPEDAPALRDELYEVWIENSEGGVAASGTATVGA